MKRDLFNLYDPGDGVPAVATLTSALRTTTDEHGVRTLRYNGVTVGHYHRTRQPRLWRGVTPGGAIVYGRTELDVRGALLERFA